MTEGTLLHHIITYVDRRAIILLSKHRQEAITVCHVAHFVTHPQFLLLPKNTTLMKRSINQIKARTSHPQYTNEQHLSPPVGVIMQVLKSRLLKMKHWGIQTNNNDMPLSDISRAMRLNMATHH